MGKSVECTVRMMDIWDMLSISGEINFILQKKNLEMDKGIILLVDEDVSEEFVIRKMQESMDVVMVDKLSGLKKSIWNYQIAVHRYTRYDKLEDLYFFLHMQKVLTVVIIRGVIPENMKEMGYIFRVSRKLVNKLLNPKFIKDVKEMKNFVRKNAEIVANELELLKSSKILADKQAEKPLFANLVAASQICITFFRSTHSESDTELQEICLKTKVKDYVEHAFELAEECDSVDAIKKSINHYFDENGGYLLGNIDHISKEIDEAIENGNVILYDTNFYYISEKMFRKSCELLLGIISLSEIKRILCEDEVLYCNKLMANCFTVKKMFINSCGEPCRERFVKLRKEFLCTEDGVMLEERKGGREDVHRKNIRICIKNQFKRPK